jgi:hypothetical protein
LSSFLATLHASRARRKVVIVDDDPAIRKPAADDGG